MVDGNLTQNSQTLEGGASARVHHNGYWGFAATNDPGAGEVERLESRARQNAVAMGRFGARAAQSLPGGSYRGEHVFRGRPPISQNECVERLSALHA